MKYNPKSKRTDPKGTAANRKSLNDLTANKNIDDIIALSKLTNKHTSDISGLNNDVRILKGDVSSLQSSKQNNIKLTTDGFSGPSTLVGSKLNIPDYSLALTGYVPYVGATQDVNLGEFGITAGQFTLDVSPTGTAAVGTTRWNNTIGSSETTLKGGNVILKNGVDLVARVVNKVTPNTTLTKAGYAAVRVSGAQGQRLAVAYAQANNDNNSADTIGLVTETIATNQEGFIITVGQLEEINTTGSLQGETWADGDVLYLSPTIPGGLTNVKPNGSTGHIVVMGYVEYAHANHGKIYVKIMNGWELDELHNVYINNPLNNQGLFYNASDQLWKNKSIDSALGYTPVPDSRRLTINGTAYDLTADRTWSVGTVTSVTASSPLSSSGGTTPNITISQATGSTNGYLSSADWTTFNSKQPAGNYITSLSGEATGSGPGTAAVTLNNASVTAKVLTGVNITGGSISASDSILTAFGKLQNQINGLIGSSVYQGTWNASTNTPALASGVGTRGYYYIVNVAGSTNLDGITDWNVGDWAIFDGTAWQQVDNTDSVTSVNGQTGAVSLTTDNIPEGATNLYFTQLRARQSITLTTSGSSGASTYNNSTGALNIPNYTLSGLGGVPSSRRLEINGISYDLSADRSWSVGTVTSIATSGPLTGGTITGSGTIGITQATPFTDGYLSYFDWNTFNNKQNAITLTTTGTSGPATLIGSTLNIPQYQDVITNPVTGTGSANYVARWTSSSNISTGVLYDNGTNVGIGTASPAEKLDVVGNLRLQNSSLGATIYFGSGAGDYLGYYNSDSYYRTVGSHYFEGAGFYKGLWNSIGQLGIGNTNPTQLVDIGISGAQKSLRVRGTYNFDGSYLSSATSNGGAKIEFVAHTGVNTSSAYRIQHDRDQTPDLIFSYAGSAAAYSSLSYSELMRLDPNANLGLGTSAMTVISGYRTFSMDAPSGTFTEYRQNTVNHMRIGADGGRPFIYCESPNPLDIYTGASFTMRLASNGNVGIGTTNPTSKLHVWNDKIEVTGFPSAGNPFTFLESNYNDQSAVTIRFLNYNPSNGYDSDLGIQLMNTGGSMFDAMIIKGSTGNLGIGTNTPSQKLSVIGNVYANGGFIGYRLDGGIGLEVNGGDLGTGSFIAKFNDYNNTSKVVINGVGDVGIGTTTPTKYMSSTETLMSIVNSNVASLYLYSTTGHLYNMSSISNGDLFWYDVSAGTERMRLTGSGNFGIGISSPAYKLDITASSTSDGFRVNLGGTSKIIANGDGVLAWGASANQGALTWDGSKAIVMGQSGNALSLGANGTWDRLYITTSGNVGIGTTSPQGILAVDGGDFRFNYGNSSSSYYFWLNKSSSADGGILLTRDNSLDWQIVNNTGTGDLGFYSYGSGTQALYIKKSNGNVGINTTNPGVKFEVAGQAFVDKFQYTQGIQISGGDLNDVTTAGFYAGSSLGNAPNAGWFYVTVERHSDAGWVHQLATSYGAGNTENEIYSRTKINGSTWMPWKKIAYSSDVPTATSVYDLLPNARVDFNWVGQVVNGTWVDIFTRANNVLTSGTWMVNMYISDYATGGEHYQYTYSGTFTWFQGGTNQSGTPAASEIALHRMGHAANSTVLYLRTKEETAADGGNGKFQISANYSHFANTTINFKFVKII